MDKLNELMNSSLVAGAAIAVLASWLTTRSRNRQEQQAEIGALRVQADAMTVAVTELHGAATTNRLLWDGPAERGRTFLLTVLAFAGGAARARIAGGTDTQSGLAGFGRAAELLSLERVASKQTAVAVREPPDLGSPGTSRRSARLSRSEACEARRTLETVRSTAPSGRWVGSIRV
jgi:hypothetical protein